MSDVLVELVDRDLERGTHGTATFRCVVGDAPSFQVVADVELDEGDDSVGIARGWVANVPEGVDPAVDRAIWDIVTKWNPYPHDD